MADFTNFSGRGGKPNAGERRLIEACATGQQADCAELSEAQKHISAELIVALGTGQFAHKNWPDWKLHDCGLRLAGAVIKQRVRADERTFPSSMHFSLCQFEEAVTFADSKVDGHLTFDGCRLQGKTDFSDTEITGQLSARPIAGRRAEFLNSGDIAIFAQGVKAAGWFLDGVRVEGQFVICAAEINGQIGAGVGQQLRAEFINPGGRAIFAQELKATLFLIDGAKVEGECNFSLAEISKEFSASAHDEIQTEFVNAGGLAIVAERAKIGSWFMDGARVVGECRINSAEISGQFSAVSLNGFRAEFINPGRRAISAQNFRVVDVFLDAARVEGECSIVAAQISGRWSSVDLGGPGSEFVNPGGDAIRASYARIDGGFWLGGRSGIAVTKVVGELDLSHARIGVRAHLAGTEFDSGDGKVAIRAKMAQFTERLVMPDCAIRGRIDLSRAFCDTLEDRIAGWPPPVAKANTAIIRKSGMFDDTEQDIEHLVLDGFTYNHFEFADGGTGQRPGVARKRWLESQSHEALGTEFDPQPWRQCAKVLREMGHEEDAQMISIARRRKERASGTLGSWAYFINSLLDLVADYGFNPWKAVVVSLGAIALFGLIYWGSSAACGPTDRFLASRAVCSGGPAFVQARYNDFEEVTLNTGPPGIETKGRPGYPAFQPFFFSLDLFIPVLDLGSEGYWRANTQMELITPAGRDALGQGLQPSALSVLPFGKVIYGLTVLQMLLGSLLIAIIITGFTGILTRDER